MSDAEAESERSASRSPSAENASGDESDRSAAVEASRSRSASHDSAKSAGSAKKSASKDRSKSRSRSRSRSGSRRRRRHSRSRSRSPYYNRRSRSPYYRRNSYRRRYRSRSRSRSYSPYYNSRGSRRYSDDGYRRGGGGYGRSRSRSPMSSRRRHVGDREKPEESRCVGVFGLSLYTTERELRDEFSRYGSIEDLQIVYDHQTRRSRGFAFIYYRSTDGAAEAKERAPGTEIDGRKIRVDYSITERAHTPTPGIYLGQPTQKSSGGRRHTRSRSRSYSPRRY